MPELPEVETTCRGIRPHLEGQRVLAVTVRQPRLRTRVSPRLRASLPGQRITSVGRRGKYLLLRSASGTVIIHLGMSGSLRILPPDTAAGKHDHVDLLFETAAGNRLLRFNDPRRFGCLVWTTRDPLAHARLRNLGPEPLENGFDGRHLHTVSRGRRVPVKSFIMDGRVVVGVGNIYANEALFLAGIHPRRAAGRLSASRCDRLAERIKDVLAAAIQAGGTTLRDFTSSDGSAGYFKQELNVYGRGGQACPRCAGTLRESRLGQRSTVHCPRCQR